MAEPLLIGEGNIWCNDTGKKQQTSLESESMACN